MSAGNWNKTTIVLALLQFFLLCTKADEVALRGNTSPSQNVSTSLEDYIKQNDRQYAAQLANNEIEIAEFRASYQRQLDTLNYNRDLVESKISDADKKLYPLEFLNELTKHCVQRYSSILVTTATVRSAFLNCVSSATSELSSILSSPDSTQRFLNSHYNSNWKIGLNNCVSKNSASYTNHTICVTQLIANTNSYFNSNQRKFDTQMEASLCSANARIRQTVECVFSTVHSSLGSVAVATRLIDDCIAGIELCENTNVSNRTSSTS